MYDNEMEKLRKLYNCGCFVPEFYSKKIKGISSFESYENFCNIPFTFKDDVRAVPAEQRTTCKRADVLGLFSSSGTTGDKTYYYYSHKDRNVHSEFVKAFFTELSITDEDIGGIFAPIGTGVMAHTMIWEFDIMGAGYVNCPVPSPENIVSLLKIAPITAAATRPNILSTIAYRKEWIKAAQSSSVKKLLLGGGFLSESRRKMLENIWNAECYNLFGMSEMFGPMAAECKCKNGLHYLDKYLMIEIIDPETGLPVPMGETGIAVYTTLWDKGFPLLRYWTDDIMSISCEKCECGSELPRIFYHGRIADSIKIGSRYVFPKQLEEILIDKGFIYDYKAVMNDGKVTLDIEKTPELEMDIQTINEIKELFNGADIDIQFLNPGQLEYFGFGKRFFM